MAAFANVLTSFSHWLAVTIFGDPCQLLPFHLSGPANEFRKNAILSVLALLEEKGYPVLRLEYQYRMAPAISQWVSQFFYEGLLKNHKSVFVDSPYRQIARQISRELYGCAGPTGTGSEYWMIDVVNGKSRVQNNGTSLQNYANADRLAISRRSNTRQGGRCLENNRAGLLHRSITFGELQDREDDHGQRKTMEIQLRPDYFLGRFLPGRRERVYLYRSCRRSSAVAENSTQNRC